MKKFIFILLMLLLPASLCFADYDYEAHSDEIIADMEANPQNYIYCGGTGGIGVSTWLRVNSLNVHLYDPPYYIIEVEKLVYAIPHTVPDCITSRGSGKVRFLYNYDTRRISEEQYNGEWEYITPLKKDDYYGKVTRVATAEIAFYLAYGISFFKEPLSYTSKNFILDGITNCKVDNNLNRKGSAYYNFRTHSVEWYEVVHRNGKSIRVPVN